MPNGHIAVKAHETNIEKIVQLEAEQQKRVSAAIVGGYRQIRRHQRIHCTAACHCRTVDCSEQ